jgi:hypothetical protein
MEPTQSSLGTISLNTGWILNLLVLLTIIPRIIIGRSFGPLIPYLGTRSFFGESFKTLSQLRLPYPKEELLATLYALDAFRRKKL